jgi:hypothetical protein
MTDQDDAFDLEIETLRIVVNTVGENAVTQDEMDVATILAKLLARIERMAGSTVH